MGFLKNFFNGTTHFCKKLTSLAIYTAKNLVPATLLGASNALFSVGDGVVESDVKKPLTIGILVAGSLYYVIEKIMFIQDTDVKLGAHLSKWHLFVYPAVVGSSLVLCVSSIFLMDSNPIISAYFAGFSVCSPCLGAILHDVYRKSSCGKITKREEDLMEKVHKLNRLVKHGKEKVVINMLRDANLLEFEVLQKILKEKNSKHTEPNSRISISPLLTYFSCCNKKTVEVPAANKQSSGDNLKAETLQKGDSDLNEDSDSSDSQEMNEQDFKELDRDSYLEGEALNDRNSNKSLELASVRGVKTKNYK